MNIKALFFVLGLGCLAVLGYVIVELLEVLGLWRLIYVLLQMGG